MRYFGDCSPDNWAFRPIDNLPPRAVIDANVLLDFVLIVDGAGRAVIDELRHQKVALYTTIEAVNEAKKTILSIRDGRHDIASLVDIAVKQSRILLYQTNKRIAGIQAHDNHLAAAAVELNAFVISEDLPLLYDLNQAQIHGRSLRETLLACILEEPHQDALVFGIGSGADGHVFMKFMMDKNECNEEKRLWFLFDAPEFMSICYNGNTRSFDMSWDAGGSLTLPATLRANTQYALYFRYTVGKHTEAQIKLCSVGSETELVAHGVLKAITQPPRGNIILMNSREMNVGWSGFLHNVTFGPYVLSRKVWRACRSLIGVAPPTLTADLTLAAATLTDVVGNQIRLPSRENVLQLTHMIIPGVYPGRRKAERPGVLFD